MNNRIVWQNRYNIGVDFIDKEHRKLFSIINKLFEYGENDEKTQWVIQEGIKYFKGHAMQHFAEEEMYMASIHYEGYDRHRRIHDNFRKQTLPALEKELNESGYSPDSIKHFLGVCAGWLFGHTLTEDRAIAGQTSSKWENLMPEEDVALMSQTIIQVVDDLFQKEAKVISEHYTGEKFGKGLYYRLLYSSSEGKEWEVLLIFEERVILSSLGDMIAQTDKVNVMLVNAVRYAAKQFVDRIRSRFSSLSSYELKEENLLTYEQFKKAFGKGQPKCSLLLGTEDGYFVFCDRSVHYLQDNVAVSIKTENATAEIKKYLKSGDEGQKSTILVVDDSSVLRQAMKELLGKDYDISEAASGVAAIQSIAINRPDLILLDYEMPVCDGSQVLEMIRSEENMADIPVIFLTGRVDAESVKKVMALKPAGYLLKTLKPEEIKVNIDGYFKKQKKVKA
ncbi:MAG: response regulator [Roseburia sp.]|nr:response regulator [Roseburia sp.]